MAMPPPSADDAAATPGDPQRNERVDSAIKQIAYATNAQYLNFLNSDTCARLERRGFQRFLIADGLWSFGLWRRGDDINLFFLTHDSESRWVEVVTEALGIEVDAAELREATKSGTMDLSDERLCFFRDGRRTQYYLMRSDKAVKARIVLRYCKIAPEWVGSTELTSVFKDMRNGLLPEWPDHLPIKSYTQNVEWLCFLKAQCNRVDEGRLERIRQTYHYAHAWAGLNHLWEPDVFDPTTLWCAIVKSSTLDKIDAESTAETMFIDTLKDWAADRFFPCPGYIISLRPAAMASLGDMQKTLQSVRAFARSAKLADSGDTAAAPPSPTAPQNGVPQSALKLRSARSVLNRLRYDVKHAGIAYDVGYVDRFAGMKWLPLAKWGGKQTEEEDFIPEHRIRQVVRVEDGAVVWDRAKKIDRTGRV